MHLSCLSPAVFLLAMAALGTQAAAEDNTTAVAAANETISKAGSVKFLLALHYYYNPDAMTIGGAGCGGGNNKCDVTFNVQITSGTAIGDVLNFKQGDNPYPWTKIVIFQNSIGRGTASIPNPIEIELKSDVVARSSMTVEVDVSQVRGNGHYSLMDQFKKTVDINPPFFKDFLLLFTSGKEFKNDPSRLSVSYALLCYENYYGPKCDVYCKPEDSDAGHYECDAFGHKKCLHNWADPELNCTAPSPCSRKPCKNQGTCIDLSVDRYMCACPPGLIGDECENGLLHCAVNHCKNGGTCSVINGKKHCGCPKGFGGTICHLPVLWCKNYAPCLNRAECIEQKGGYTCVCQLGYTGLNCETAINSCRKSNPCQNGGKCLEDKYGAITCECPVGIQGKLCEQDVDECDRSPCKNNEKCINTLGSYLCELMDGDECNGVVCGQGGVCVDMPYKYYCQCRAGFSGSLCNFTVQQNFVRQLKALGDRGSTLKPPMSAFAMCVTLTFVTIFQSAIWF